MRSQYVLVSLCASLGLGLSEELLTVNGDKERGSEQGRMAVDGLQEMSGIGGVLAFGLIGATMALLNNPRRRSDLGFSVSNRRSDIDDGPRYPGYHNYARRINSFEKNFKHNIGYSARAAKRLATNGMVNTVRRLGLLGKVTSRMANRGFSNMASGASNIARVAGSGIGNLQTAASVGSRRFIQGLARAGHASRRRLSNYGRSIGRFGQGARDRISRIGSAYGRGLDVLTHGVDRIGSAYWNGLNTIGSAASAIPSTIGSAANHGVSRIGELASEGAAQIGGLATNIVDVATVVPKGVMAVAKEKRVQDCLLQTLCYVSSPYVKDHTQHKRLIRSLSRHLRSVHDQEREEPGNFRTEDCEVFQCEVASMGRKAYKYVRNDQ